jgi:hypothetical protein
MIPYDLDSPVQRILARRDVLALSPDQIRKLNELEIEFCKETVRLLSQRQLLELDVRRAGLDSESGLGVTPESLAAIDEVTARLRQCWLTARQTAQRLLSQDQLSKLSEAQIVVPTYAPDPAAPESISLDSMISNAVAARIKDARVVEIETTQAIAERILAWAKSAAIVATIPLALLAAVLGILGFSKWTDFSEKINAASADFNKKIDAASADFTKKFDAANTDFTKKFDAANKDISEKLEAAQHRAHDIDELGTALNVQYEKLGQKLSSIPTIQANVSSLQDKFRDLSGKVDQLEQVTFEHHGNLPSAIQEHLGEIQTEISKDISDYGSYLHSIGYTPLTKNLSVEISTEDDDNAYFDGEKLVIGSNLVRLPDVIYREYTNRMLKEVNPSSWNIQDWKAVAIISGLGDYFPCSYVGNPKFGVEAAKLLYKIAPTAIPSGYLRNLANDRQFVSDSAPPAAPVGQPSKEPHGAGEVWGGAFWDIRRILGCKDEAKRCQKADRILLASVPSLKEGPDVVMPFAASIIDNTRSAAGTQEAEEVRAAFARRGLKVKLEKN